VKKKTEKKEPSFTRVDIVSVLRQAGYRGKCAEKCEFLFGLATCNPVRAKNFLTSAGIKKLNLNTQLPLFRAKVNAELCGQTNALKNKKEYKIFRKVYAKTKVAKA